MDLAWCLVCEKKLLSEASLYCSPGCQLLDFQLVSPTLGTLPSPLSPLWTGSGLSKGMLSSPVSCLSHTPADPLPNLTRIYEIDPAKPGKSERPTSTEVISPPMSPRLLDPSATAVTPSSITVTTRPLAHSDPTRPNQRHLSTSSSSPSLSSPPLKFQSQSQSANNHHHRHQSLNQGTTNGHIYFPLLLRRRSSATVQTMWVHG